MARTSNELQDDTDLRVAVGVIQSQIGDMKIVVGRIEKKIDNNSYVHESKYADDRKSDKETYATKEEIKPIKNMFYAVLTTVVTTLVVGAIYVIGRGQA